MYNTDNVYYFPNNIDVRVCPKNGNSSIKQFFINVSGTIFPDRKLKEEFIHFASKKRTPVSWREKQILDFGDQFDLPFRKDSIRIAIKRDPIDRFKSAVEMLQSQMLINHSTAEETEFNISGIDKNYKKFYTSVDEILSDLENNIVVNMHFWTQTHFLGNKSKYNIVYDINDFEKFQRYILQSCDIKYSAKWQIHLNYSNNSLSKMQKIIENNKRSIFISKQLHFKVLEDKQKITNNLSTKNISKIKKLYEIDYDNEWY
jgi:hypothetical protein